MAPPAQYGPVHGMVAVRRRLGGQVRLNEPIEIADEVLRQFVGRVGVMVVNPVRRKTQANRRSEP